MKSIYLLIILSITTFGGVSAQNTVTYTGTNQDIFNWRSNGRIIYSEADNKLYAVTMDHFDNSIWYLDTFNYDLNIWQQLDSAVPAEMQNLLIDELGNIVYTTISGTDVILHTLDPQMQPISSVTSSGIPAITSAMIVKAETDNYWMRGSDFVLHYDGSTWNHIPAPATFGSIAVSQSDIPYILTGYTTVHKYDGGNWSIVCDSTLAGAMWPMGMELFVTSEDSVYLLEYYGDMMAEWVRVIGVDANGDPYQIGNNIFSSIEITTGYQAVVDLNDELIITTSEHQLGPWASLSFQSYFNTGNWGATYGLHANDNPNHMATTKDMALDKYNCAHVLYSYSTDGFSFPDTLNVRIRKFCKCQYVENLYTVDNQEPDLIANADLPLNYQWLDCNNNFDSIPGETDSIYTAVVNGSYAVEVEANGCIDTSECFVISAIGVGLDEYDLNSNVQFYPNPATDKIKVIISDSEKVMVEITDLTGKTMIEKMQLSNGDLIDLTGLSSGTYFISLMNDGVLSTEKLIIQ